MPNPFLALVCALGAWLLPSTVGTALSAQPTRGLGELDEVVEVTVVNIDVFARDRGGRPLADLERSDFRVFDNDQRVDISHFSRGSAFSADATVPISEQLSLVFLIDNLHLSAESRDLVLPQLKAFAERHMQSANATPATEVHAMVVSFDGQLRMLQDLTTDYLLLAQGFNRAEARAENLSQAQSLKRRSQESFGLLMSQLSGSRFEAVAGLASLETTFSELAGYARVLHEDALASREGLQVMIDSLALVPGRKALIYVSDGFAMRPFDRLLQTLQKRLIGGRDDQGDDLMRRGTADGIVGFANDSNAVTGGSNAVGYARLRAGQFQKTVSELDTLPEFEQLAAEANSNRITIYSLKPPDVEAAKVALGERVADSQSMDYQSDLRLVLQLLSEETGGAAFVSGSSVGDYLDRASDDLGHYYSLGYQLDELEAGSVHRVTVKAKRRGARLRYRSRYVARPLRQLLQDRTSGALLLGWTENPHQLRIDDVSAEVAEGGLYDVTLTASLPLSRLELVTHDSVVQGQIRVVVAVLTEDRESLEPQHIALPLRIPKADWSQAKDQFFGVEFALSLPRGRHKVALGLWDESSGMSSYIRHDLTVRDSSESSDG